MALLLSAREHEMLATVLRQMEDLPKVDFDKVAEKTGHKYTRNARSAFKKVWEKLRSANSNVVDGAEFGDDGETAAPVKSKGKATPKKGVGKHTTPRKASANGPKAKRKTKKEREIEQAAIAQALAAAEDEDIADADEDRDSVEGGGSDEENDAESGKEEGDDQKEEKGGVKMMEDGEAPKYEEDDEELGSRLMGIPLEEFREMAKETRWFTAAATPEPTRCSEDEAA